jgi:hypothetical protein
MSEKAGDPNNSRPSTSSSTAQEENVRHSNGGSQIVGEPDSNHEDVEKIVPGHEFDMDLQSVCRALWTMMMLMMRCG